MASILVRYQSGNSFNEAWTAETKIGMIIAFAPTKGTHTTAVILTPDKRFITRTLAAIRFLGFTEGLNWTPTHLPDY